MLSHISYSSGQIFPVRGLAALAHKRGVWLFVDAAQSVGQLPVNVRDLDCDFCAFPGATWTATSVLFPGTNGFSDPPRPEPYSCAGN